MVNRLPSPNCRALLQLATLRFRGGTRIFKFRQSRLADRSAASARVIALIKSDATYLREVRRRAALPAGAAFLRIGRLTTGSGLTSSTGRLVHR